jgi:acetoacetate decarboxylase
MKLAEVRRKAFAMPLNDPAYPPGPYKFYNREFIVITYRTDIDTSGTLSSSQCTMSRT